LTRRELELLLKRKSSFVLDFSPTKKSRGVFS
jgi:hypothetical protein